MKSIKKGVQGFELLRTFSCFCFCCQCLCLNFCFYTSLVGVLFGIASSAVRMKIFAITAGIKKYKSVNKKKWKKYNEIVLLGKAKLDTTKLLISKVLIDSYISHGEFVSVNNVLRE